MVSGLEVQCIQYSAGVKRLRSFPFLFPGFWHSFLFPGAPAGTNIRRNPLERKEEVDAVSSKKKG